MQNETKWEEPKQDEEMAASGSSSFGVSFVLRLIPEWRGRSQVSERIIGND